MSIMKQSNGTVAEVKRYDWNLKSPLFGRWYINIIGRDGSKNEGVPESFRTKSEAMDYLMQLKFKEVK